MGRRKGTVKGKDSCIMPFHYLLTTSLVSGAFSFNLLPSSFPRVGVEADCWAHWRLKKLMFRLHRGATINGPQAIAYVGGVEDTPVSSITQAMEILPSAYMTQTQTVPTEWVHVTKLEMSGPLPWYKTVAGTADPTEESPGQVAITGSGTDAFYAEFRGTLEFKTSLATANTPMAIKYRQVVREERLRRVQELERAALLRVLSTTPIASTSLGPASGLLKST